MQAPRLPRIRSYNWRIMLKNNRRAVWLTVIAAMLGFLIYSGIEYGMEHNLRLTRENEIRDLLAAHLKPPIGAPGTTATDFIEGTERMDK